MSSHTFHLIIVTLFMNASTIAIAQKLNETLWNSGINYQRYHQANQALTPLETSPITTVLMGDSITDGWIDQRPEFFSENNIIDRGIGGETTGQMLLRFREDVIKLRPKVVAILAGINDIAENNGPIELERVFGNIVSMVDLAKANNIQVILCKLVPANRFPWRPQIIPTQKVKQLNEMIASYAKSHHLVLVDYFSPMADSNSGLKAELGSDGVHPNKKGYALMEPLLLEGIEAALQIN